MIAAHQPHIFGTTLRAVVSSRTDGDMKFGVSRDDEVIGNRRVFLAQANITLEQTVLVKVSYDKDDFAVYRRVDKAQAGQGMQNLTEEVADALLTAEPGVALFLPVADCVATVLYDPTKRVLMVSHLGRQSIEQDGGAKSVHYIAGICGSSPADLLVWLSPASGKENYPLKAFEGRGMQEVVQEQLLAAGVASDHIETSPVDTTTSEEYFSHSEFLKGSRDSDGRFAVVAMMSEQGEPASFSATL
jgi:copper oxidase (laccase) domain-containing protein